MVKLAFCLRRRSELTVDSFHDYWLNKHGPLVLKHARTLRIEKYIQLHTLDTPLNDALRKARGGPSAFDGVAELWWKDMATLEKVMNDPEARPALQELLDDERKFIDLERSPVWVAEEHKLIG